MKNKQNYPSSKASGSQRGQMPGKLSGKITGQLLPQTVLDAVLASRQPLKVEELMAGLGLEKKNRKRLLNLLADLLEAEDLLYLPGGRYAAADQLKQIIGRLEVQRSGMGFVISKDPSLKGKDVYISSAHLARAWTGDTVKVGLLPDQRGKSPEGLILKVLKRKIKNILVRVVRQSAPGEVLCTPLDSRYANAVLADITSLPEQVLKGDILNVSPAEHLEQGLWRASVISNVGSGEDVPTQEEMTKLSHNIPTYFPSEVLAEAAALPAEPCLAQGGDDWIGREDLRHLNFVTIDGARAKDFDDAVYVERKGKTFILYVSIADVTHYVQQGSALDREAAERGNSYYFAQSVEPMLPEHLSNGLCSLKPLENRLTVTAQMEFSAQEQRGGQQAGQRIGQPRIFFSVIQSRARLIYDSVYRALDENNPIDRALLGPLLPMLEDAKILALALQKKRMAQGALFLDLPETEPQFDAQGRVSDIQIVPGNFAHQLIEEFMIAANEAVAEFLTAADKISTAQFEKIKPFDPGEDEEKTSSENHSAQLFPYRVHPYPDADKLSALFRTLTRTGLAELAPKAGAEVLPAILAKAHHSDDEYVVSSLVLRSMMQARYSSELAGHFGLASNCYCHFTSPIRRYADVLVHRALRRALGQPHGGKLNRASLDKVIDGINECEKIAKDAEHELEKRIGVLFLQNKIGETFTGRISGITDFGIFVELSGNMVEGMVKLHSLTDYFDYIPERHELLGQRSGKRFKLGQAVRVRVLEAHIYSLEIQLEILDF